MMAPCDVVAERLALDEPLAELTQHADDCPRCQGLLAAQRSLLGTRRRNATPAHGFAARMTVQANQRLVVRHRRRVAGYAMLSAALAAMVTFVVMRDPDKGRAPAPVASSQLKGEEEREAGEEREERDPWKEPGPAEVPDELEEPVALEQELEDGDAPRDEDAFLLRVLSETAAAPVSADWQKIEEPLAPYDRLLRQVGEP
jgi:hypothetical protein